MPARSQQHGDVSRNLSGRKVLVSVEQDIGDAMVVSYVRGSAQFRGVLLDSTNRNIPVGIRLPGDDASQPPPSDVDWPASYRRFSYFTAAANGGAARAATPSLQLFNNRGGNRTKPMRLRARKVLCSNCHAVCSERRSHNISSNPYSNASSKVSHAVTVHMPVNGRRNINHLQPPPPPPPSSSSMSASSSSMSSSSSSMSSSSSSSSSLPVNTSRVTRLCWRGIGYEKKGVVNEVGGGDMVRTRRSSGKERPMIRIQFSRDGKGRPSIVNIQRTEDLDGWEKESSGGRKRKKRGKRKGKKRKREKEDDENEGSEEDENSVDVSSVEENKRLTVAVCNLKLGESQTVKVDDKGDVVKDTSDRIDMTENATSVCMMKVMTSGGHIIEIEGIVWGKAPGYPWWPGRVLAINRHIEEVDEDAVAKVAWFGSTTFSSEMNCSSLEPFLPSYKARFNRKKKGPYQKAVREAALAAKERAKLKQREDIVRDVVVDILHTANIDDLCETYITCQYLLYQCELWSSDSFTQFYPDIYPPFLTYPPVPLLLTPETVSEIIVSPGLKYPDISNEDLTCDSPEEVILYHITPVNSPKDDVSAMEPLLTPSLPDTTRPQTTSTPIDYNLCLAGEITLQNLMSTMPLLFDCEMCLSTIISQIPSPTTCPSSPSTSTPQLSPSSPITYSSSTPPISSPSPPPSSPPLSSSSTPTALSPHTLLATQLSVS